MKWFKKIFKKNVESNSDITIPNSQEYVSNISSGYRFEDRFIDIDYDFIDLYYFSNNDEKSQFIIDLKQTILTLGINEVTNYISANKKISDYYLNNQNTLPLLSYCLLFSSFKIIENGLKTEIIKEEIKQKGIEKINNYYSALSFCSINLNRKTDRNYYNLEFEHNLIIKVTNENNNPDYARLNAFYELGVAYKKANNLQLMENAFNLIPLDKYDLAPATVGKFYKLIGEIYIEISNEEKAINWFEKGVEIYPNLGVKKILSKLKRD